MKIIFLDIDGVLNTRANWGQRGVGALTPELVVRVAKLAKATDASIVISSTWRRRDGIVRVIELLEQTGFHHAREYVIGETPWVGSRAEDIANWLSRNEGVEAYVILDDDTAGEGLRSNPPPNFVPIDSMAGLTAADARAAEKLLKKAA